MQTLTGQTIGKRYQTLDQLGMGGMGVVYRAVDRLTGQVVALKKVTELHAMPDLAGDTNFRLTLAQEFKTLASLRHPHIISVLDYGFDDEFQPYYTMELVEDAQTVLEATQSRPLVFKINLLLQILQALTYLHRRGILHLDLKPANLLVAEGVAKVVDFGLAITRQYEPPESDMVAGTLTYIAPEVLQGHPSTESADLYAVGVLAYEMFAGQHPFYTLDITRMIDNILMHEPDMSRLSVSPALAQVIGRLLSKAPEHRFSSAHATAVALMESIGQPIPIETAETRESFLQAAQFVGRDAQLTTLHNALKQAVDTEVRRGSAWLVGGESGVGKSRLLDELRTLALVEGALVLRGQTVSEGSAPYQSFREPLRRLVLETDLTPMEAGILSEVIPNLSELVEQNPEPPPLLEGKARQTRLAFTIIDLFRKQTRPILLLLEDLHWIGESAEILGRLSQVAPELPLLVVATYRDDERPDLPALFPAMQLMKLERLSPPDIEALSVSMLGPVGLDEQLLELLRRETEGNAFFIIEVVRALAEEAGRLDSIGTITLPTKVFAGGIRTVVNRRLSRVPPSAQGLLKLAAVAGRRLDLRLLKHLSPNTNLDWWLTTCAEAVVLEFYEGDWRFSHDKLRDGLLNNLGEDERRALHWRVAQAIESLHPDDPLVMASLAEHWYAARDIAKALEYACAAGEQSLDICDYAEAELILSRAAALLSENNPPSSQARQLLQLLGDAYTRQANYVAAQDAYEHSLNLALEQQDEFARTHILNSIAFMEMYRSNYELSRSKSLEALEIAQRIGDQKNSARAFNNLGVIAEYQGDFTSAVSYYRHALSLFRELDDLRGLASCLNNLGSIADSEGRYDDAQRYYQESLIICKQIDYRQGIAVLTNNLGIIAERLNDIEGADRSYLDSMNMSRAIGDRRGVSNCLANRVFTLLKLGRVEDARRAWREGMEIAHQIGASAIILHFMAGAGQVHLAAGQPEHAAEIIGTLQGHPGADADFQAVRLMPLLNETRARLPAETFEHAFKRGEGISLESAVQTQMGQLN
jgi:tetratricopeptide (TPR) repeat protein/energy-coupling factor transporter ATP-binding protein EcfA2